MATQEQCRDGIPRKDGDRPGPDVERDRGDSASDSRKQ
jgi:hypothetical protein